MRAVLLSTLIWCFMADPRNDTLAAMLEEAYGPGSVGTGEIAAGMPARSPLQGMFSAKGIPTVADLLRSSQGGMLTAGQTAAGFGEMPKDILAGLLGGPQRAVGHALGAAQEFSPEAAFLASLLGPKAAGNLAKAGDLRPQRALDAAKEINARMVADGAPLEDINTAIHRATIKILGGKDPVGEKVLNPDTGRMKNPPRENSPYGGAFRIPSHLDNPPRYLSGSELEAHTAARETYNRNPDFAFEVSDAGPRGLTLHNNQLRAPWYAPWRNPRGTQTGLEGPLAEHPMLRKAYPEGIIYLTKMR